MSSSQRTNKVVYILAASHSGSTLLAMLLNAHPEVVSVGELAPGSFGDVSRYRCSCQRLLLECPFWNSVCQAMVRRGVEFDGANFNTHLSANGSVWVQRLLRPLHRGSLFEAARDAALSFSPTWRAHLPEIQRRNAGFVASLLEVSGKKFVVDSSKIGLRLKYLLRNSELDVRVIHLVRDGRAVALTYTDPAQFADARDPNRRGGGSGGDRKDERLSMAQAAREWRRSVEEAESILASLDPTRWMAVRYEDVCGKTGTTLGRLLSFLGASALAVLPRDFRAVEHHVVGNGMRLDTTPDIQLDERWRCVLGREDLAVFESVAGSTNRRHGYR